MHLHLIRTRIIISSAAYFAIFTTRVLSTTTLALLVQLMFTSAIGHPPFFIPRMIYSSLRLPLARSVILCADSTLNIRSLRSSITTDMMYITTSVPRSPLMTFPRKVEYHVLKLCTTLLFTSNDSFVFLDCYQTVLRPPNNHLAVYSSVMMLNKDFSIGAYPFLLTYLRSQFPILPRVLPPIYLQGPLTGLGVGVEQDARCLLYAVH